MASGEFEVPVYLRILTPRILQALAIASLAASLLMILLGLFDPLRFEDDIARFMLCLAVATALAVFFFIFYPERVETNLPIGIGTTLRVAGPLALWVGVFLFLLHFVPSPEYGRVFEVWKNGRRGGMYFGDSSTTYLTVKQGSPPSHMLIGANDGTRDMFGIYVIFPRNVRKIEAQLHHEGWPAPLPVSLSRDGTSIIDLSSVK